MVMYSPWMTADLDPPQSALAGSLIHVEATILVSEAAVWCCRSVDFATFVLAGSPLAAAVSRRERC